MACFVSPLPGLSIDDGYSINATVMGSKAAGKDEEGGEAEADEAKENGTAEEEEVAAEE